MTKMSKYVQVLEEIMPKFPSVWFTFSGRADVFLILAFIDNDEVNPLDISLELNYLTGLEDCEFKHVYFFLVDLNLIYELCLAFWH